MHPVHAIDASRTMLSGIDAPDWYDAWVESIGQGIV